MGSVTILSILANFSWADLIGLLFRKMAPRHAFESSALPWLCSRPGQGGAGLLS